MKRILQKNIIKVVRTRNLIKIAEKDIEDARVDLAAAEKIIFDLLAEGAKVEDGKYTAGLEMYTPATRPPWKDLHLEHMKSHEGFQSLIYEAEVKTKYAQEPRQRLVVGETGRTKLTS